MQTCHTCKDYVNSDDNSDRGLTYRNLLPAVGTNTKEQQSGLNVVTENCWPGNCLQEIGIEPWLCWANAMPCSSLETLTFMQNIQDYWPSALWENLCADPSVSCHTTAHDYSSSRRPRDPPDVLQGPPSIVHKGFIDLSKHVQAFTHLAKDCMFPIQTIQILPCCYVKLARICPF